MSAFAWATLADALAYAAAAAAALRWTAASASWMPARTASMTVFASVTARVAPTTSRGVAAASCLCLGEECRRAVDIGGTIGALARAQRRSRLGDVLLHRGDRRGQLRLVLGERRLGRIHRIQLGGRLGDGGLGLLDLAAPPRPGRWPRGPWWPPPGTSLAASSLVPAASGLPATAAMFSAANRAAERAHERLGRADAGDLGIDRGDRLGQHLVDVLEQVPEGLDARHLVVDHALRPGAPVDDLLEHRVSLVGRLRLVVIQLLADEERLAQLGLGVVERLLERRRLGIAELGLGKADLLVRRSERVVGGEQQRRRLLAQVLLRGALLVRGLVGAPAAGTRRPTAADQGQQDAAR